MTHSSQGAPLPQQIVREQDYDHYLCSLFAPLEQRQPVWGVLALGYELLRIPTQVSEEMVGLVRIKWWQEQCQMLAANGRGARTDHPVLAALEPVLASGSLPITLVDALCEAIAEQAGRGIVEEDVLQTVSLVYQMLAYAIGEGDRQEWYATLGKARGAIALIRTTALPEQSFEKVKHLLSQLPALIPATVSRQQPFAHRLHKLAVIWQKRIEKAQATGNMNYIRHIPFLVLRLM